MNAARHRRSSGLRSLAVATLLGATALCWAPIQVSAAPEPETPGTAETRETHETDGLLVQFRPGVDLATAGAVLAAHGATAESFLGSTPVSAHVHLDDTQVDALSADRAVSFIEPNVILSMPTPVSAPASAPEADGRPEMVESAFQQPPVWSLDRIDQRQPTGNGGYDVAADGAGVTAYVLDSGVRSDHVDFGGRVVSGVSFVPGASTSDCQGHGTHVAGTIGGRVHGVAKGVTIVPIRVAACSSQLSTAAVINGVWWAIDHHQPGRPAVMNLSLGGPVSLTLEAAVRAAIDDGIVVVVAAGNDDRSACLESPGREPLVITVGAANRFDQRAWFSNWGPCVDLFAPGEDIRSASDASTTATEVMDGTSMAAPHVAGAVALLLQREPTLTPAQVHQRVIDDATRDALADVEAGSPNRLLYVAPSSFVPLSPARLMDTRPGTATVDGVDAGIGARVASQTTELQVAGRAGVALDASAAVLNVTVTRAQADGFLTVFPCGSPIPNSSNLNFGVGATVPNAVVVKLGIGGRVCLYSNAATDVIVDINGYHPAGSSYVSLSPARLMDTRPGAVTIDGGDAAGGLRVAGQITALRVTGRGGVAVDAAAVVLNVTATEPTAAGFVTVFPCGTPLPTSSNLNVAAGTTVPNAVVSKVGDNGEVCLFTSMAAHLIVDVNGYHGLGASYVALDPARLLETRSGATTIDGAFVALGRLASGQVLELQVTGRGGVPPTATAVMLNVTVTGTTGPGYLTVFPCGDPVPNSSNLNYEFDATIANAVVAKVGTGGAVCVVSSAATHVVVDVTGFHPA